MKKKYCVEVTMMATYTYDIESDTEKAAIDEAYESIKEDLCFDFFHKRIKVTKDE